MKDLKIPEPTKECDYEPFGPEWHADVMKMRKADIVNLWKGALKILRYLEDKPDLQALMVDISTWSDKTFGEGQRNPAILYHLEKEVKECIEAVSRFQMCGIDLIGYNGSEEACKAAFMEYADCFILLLDSAYHFGLNADVLMKFTRQKLEINKQRKWGRPDENGVVEHIREGKKCMS